MHEECKELIERNGLWEEGMTFFSSLSYNLKNVSNVLSKWGRDINHQRKKRIRECKSALKDAYKSIPFVNFDIIHGIEFELDSLLEE